MPILRSKVAIVICGAFLVGTVAGTLAATSAVWHAPTAPGSGLAQASATSPIALATAATATAAPLSHPTPPPTQPISPPPIPTPPPVPGQQQDLQGAVASTNPGANTFVLSIAGGGTITCVVNSSTQWSGTAQSVSALAPGMPTEVHGVSQTDGTLTATEVNAQNK